MTAVCWGRSGASGWPVIASGGSQIDCSTLGDTLYGLGCVERFLVLCTVCTGCEQPSGKKTRQPPWLPAKAGQGHERNLGCRDVEGERVPDLPARRRELVA